MKYMEMCVGKTNCYLLFNDTRINNAINAKISEIQRYPWIIPYYTGTPMNIGWAQAHSQAFSHKIWVSHVVNYGYAMSNPPVIAELSFARAAINGNFTNCLSPLLQDPKWNFIIHLPFFFSDDFVHYVYERPALEYDTRTLGSWCDKSYLNVDLSMYRKYLFTGYDNYQVPSTLSYRGWSSMIRGLGIGMVAIPHDLQMAAMGAYFSNGFYKLNGPMLYYYPANVVGCYLPGNGTTYAIVYAFGAHNSDTNYLFVDYKMMSLPGWITFAYDVPFVF